MEDDQPLLDPQHLEDGENDSRPLSSPTRHTKAGIGALLALLLLVNLSASLYQLPLNRVIEQRLCREHYTEYDPSVISENGGIDEKLCKIDIVQQGLAWVQGAMDTAWIVGDFVVTIPLSFMAERYGQRSVLLLNLIPRMFMLSWAVIVGYFEEDLPTKAIIAGPFLSFLGGDCVFNSITYALAARLTDDYVVRATFFGWMSSVSYVVALSGPALASATMTVLLWLPFWIGIALLLLAIPTILMLPKDTSICPALSSPIEPNRALASSPVLKAQTSSRSLWTPITARIGALRSIMVTSPRNMTLLFASFFLASLASSDTKLLAQYISKRYQWTFASAGYLLSGKAVVNFTLLTIIVPNFLRSRHSVSRPHSHYLAKSTDRSNIRYALMCLGLSVLGAMMIALAFAIWVLVPSLLIYALGSALPVFTLSLLKSPSIIPKRNEEAAETQIFSLVMMVKTLGSLVGAPLMATLWVVGIRKGHVFMGLPYFVSSACYCVAAAMIWMIVI